MTKLDNIIQFPKMKLDAPPQSPQEVANKLIEYKTNYADEISEILWDHVLGELTRAGCDFGKNIDEFFPSMVLILESIRSLHLQVNGIDHPLQKFAKESVTQDNEKKVDNSEEDD